MIRQNTRSYDTSTEEPTSSTSNSNRHLNIRSQNCKRSANIFSALLNIIEHDSHIICLQETPSGLHANNSLVGGRSHTPIIIQSPPNDTIHQIRRTAILVYEDNIHFPYSEVNTEFYAGMGNYGGDVTAISFHRPNGPQTYIINLYNPPTIRITSKEQQRKSNRCNTGEFFNLLHKSIKLLPNFAVAEFILVGDWNIHNHMWDSNYPITYKTLDCDRALEMTSDLNLRLINQRDKITRQDHRSATVIDLVFASEKILNEIDFLSFESINFAAGSDHAALDLQLPLFRGRVNNSNNKKASICESRIEWRKFKDLLLQIFQDDPINTQAWSPYHNKVWVDNAAEALTAAIYDAAKKSEYVAKRCSYNNTTSPNLTPQLKEKPFWSQEVDYVKVNARRKFNTLNRKRTKLKIAESNPIANPVRLVQLRREYSRAQRKYEEAAKKFRHIYEEAKANFTNSLFENINNQNAFKIWNHIQGVRQNPRVNVCLPLHGKTPGQTPAHTLSEALSIFETTFFPSSTRTSETILIPEDSSNTLPWADITLEDIKNSLLSCNKHSSPGEDRISFNLLKESFEVIGPSLLFLYKKILQTGHHPRCWRTADITIIRKPNKDRYDSASSYRPISILSCTSRVLEKMVASRFLHMLDTRLPPHQLGNRLRQGTDTAIAAAIHFIKSESGKGRDVVGLVMDVTGAYDHVQTDVLIKTMHEIGLPSCIIKWVVSFSTQRIGTIRINSDRGTPFPINHGIPQGSPLSPILWIIYNHPLLNKLNSARPINGDTMTIGYVDDNFTLVSMERKKGFNTRESLALHLQHKIINVAIAWGLETNMSFDPKKASLIYFTNRECNFPTKAQFINSQDEAAYANMRAYYRKSPIFPISPDYTTYGPYQDMTPSVYLGETEVKASRSVRWLGIILDELLSMKQHFLHVAARINKCVTYMRCTLNRFNFYWAKRFVFQSQEPKLFYGMLGWYPLLHMEKYAQKHIEETYKSLLDAALPRGICRMAKCIELSVMNSQDRIKYIFSSAIARYLGPSMRTDSHIIHLLMGADASPIEIRPGHVRYWIKLYEDRAAADSPLYHDLAALASFKRHPPFFHKWQNMTALEPQRGILLFKRDSVSPFIARIQRYRYLPRSHADIIFLLRSGQTKTDNDQIWRTQRRKIIPDITPSCVTTHDHSRIRNSTSLGKRTLDTPEPQAIPIGMKAPLICDRCRTTLQDSTFLLEHLIQHCPSLHAQRRVFLLHTPVYNSFIELINEPTCYTRLIAFLISCRIPINFDPASREPDSSDDPD